MGIDQQHLYHDEYFKQYICRTTRQRLVFELRTHFTLLHVLLHWLVVNLSIGRKSIGDRYVYALHAFCEVWTPIKEYVCKSVYLSRVKVSTIYPMRGVLGITCLPAQ